MIAANIVNGPPQNVLAEPHIKSRSHGFLCIVQLGCKSRLKSHLAFVSRYVYFEVTKRQQSRIGNYVFCANSSNNSPQSPRNAETDF